VSVAPLGSIGVAAADAPTPALVVIGDVVAVREALAAVPGTLVAFMGGAVVARLAERLIAYGKPASTPAAVVSRGTLDDQEVRIAPLGAIGAAAEDAPTPALVVIGEVVALREELSALQRFAA